MEHSDQICRHVETSDQTNKDTLFKIYHKMLSVTELVTTCQRTDTQMYCVWIKHEYDSPHEKGILPLITLMPILSTLTNTKTLTFPHRVRDLYTSNLFLFRKKN